jgi:uncharacterized protein
MKKLFTDTSGWMAIADGADPLHNSSIRARNQWLKDEGILVTTDYVIDETLTLIRIRLGLFAAKKWWEQVCNSPRLRVEWIDWKRAEKARRWFFGWEDQSFSFTDCTSFVVMNQLHVRKALTGDRHFATAGFEMLP